MLTELAATLKAYVVLPDHAEVAIALWILHAHAFDAAQISPFLTISSPIKRCGKSTLLALLHELVPNPMPVSSLTAASIYMDGKRVTWLIDEAERTGKDGVLRGVLNGGYNRRQAFVVRKGVRYSTWCPKVIALIGRLPDTIMDRSVVIRMRRKLGNETVERLKQNNVQRFIELNRKCARWAKDNLDALKKADPETVAGINDRASDNWEILFAIADLCGEDWGVKAREAALAIEPSPVLQASLELQEQPDEVRLLASPSSQYLSTRLHFS